MSTRYGIPFDYHPPTASICAHCPQSKDSIDAQLKRLESIDQMRRTRGVVELVDESHGGPWVLLGPEKQRFSSKDIETAIEQAAFSCGLR